MIDRTFFGDRLFQGAVIDFIDFCAFPSLWRWTFNFADACICVGVGLFIIGVIADEVRERKRKRQAPFPRRRTGKEGERGRYGPKYPV